MKQYKLYIGLFFVFFVIAGFSSCKKYLDAKTDKKLVIASSISDAQALMDNSSTLGGYCPSDGTVMADDYFLLDDYFDTRQVIQQNEFLWDSQAMTDDGTFSDSYQAILTCNVALETLTKISPSSSELASYNLAKGAALFYRAYRHYMLMTIYCLQYDKVTAGSDLGIPYKTSSDINEVLSRPSLQSNYDAVISDLKTATQILPTNTTFPTRPTKQAAFGMLARIYLSMNDYTNAFANADSCLNIYNTLMDYNDYVASGTNTPFRRFNVEDIFHNTSYALTMLQYSNCNIDSSLYNSYNSSDLRKTLFYVQNPEGYYSFRGWYDENIDGGPYGGIATDEIYLIRAECYARAGNAGAAMADLNTLLRKRYDHTFTDLTATDTQNALDIILTERRKELVMRNNLRWTDLKRLNKDPHYAKTLTRFQHGQTYTLPPNDLRYALLIPPTEIQLSGMEQNKR
jgi:hypothetical protein